MRTQFETLGTLERGDFFGEMAIIENLPRSATAIAMEDDTELIAINKSQFEKMLQSNIEVAIRMIRKYAHRLMESSIPRRIAGFLPNGLPLLDCRKTTAFCRETPGPLAHGSGERTDALVN